MSTFVSVGNAKQPFSRLIEGVTRIAHTLPQPVFIQHGHTPLAQGNYKQAAFMAMEQFSDHIESAELLILHAGAGSVLHALRAGKKPIVIPRRAEFGEHVNNHQVEFSAMLARENRIFLLENIENLDKTIKEALCFSRAGGVIAIGSRQSPPEPRMVALIREALYLRSQ